MDASTPAKMEQHVNQMLDDMKRAHRIREDQLSSAAVSYKQRLEQVVRQHEVLLVAYRCVHKCVTNSELLAHLMCHSSFFIRLFPLK
jgi:hypothetical protein